MVLDTQENWKNRIKAWENSGLSQKTYCRQEKISFSAFCYWRKKLAGSTHRFVELKFKRIDDSSIPPIAITLPNGIRIDLSINTDSKTIGSLVSSLKGIV